MTLTLGPQGWSSWPFEHAAYDRAKLPRGLLPRELILHSTSPVVTKPTGFVGVLEQSYDGLRDLGIAAGIDEQSGFPMHHGIGHAPDSAADNRLAECVGLEKCYSGTLSAREGIAKDVASAVAFKLFVTGQRAEKRDGVGDRRFGREAASDVLCLHRRPQSRTGSRAPRQRSWAVLG